MIPINVSIFTRARALVACSFFTVFGHESIARADTPSSPSDDTEARGEGAASTLPGKETAPLPPVPVDELRAKSPQPSWDTGILVAACGVGTDRAFQTTKFCGGGLADVIFLRKNESQPGLGAYGQISTAGFRDARFSAGLSGIVSLIDWFSLGLRTGGLVATTFSHTSPGLEGYFELGHRSVSHRSHYAVSHAFFGGMQFTAAAGEVPAAHAIWIGLRIDGLWLTAPKAFLP